MARWTKDQEAALRRLWELGASESRISAAFPTRTWWAISRKARRLGLAYGSIPERALPETSLADPHVVQADSVFFVNSTLYSVYRSVKNR